eukprot:5320566-Lingulodinium_polyedra.AAC.1
MPPNLWPTPAMPCPGRPSQHCPREGGALARRYARPCWPPCCGARPPHTQRPAWPRCPAPQAP